MTDLPPGWVRCRLDEIADVRLGRQRSPKNHAGKDMRPYLRAANVDWNGLKLDDVKLMNFTDEELTTYRLDPGDVVMGEASGSRAEVGKPALWNGEIEDCCFQNTLLRVRTHEALLPRYLLHFLKGEAVRGAFADQSRGVGIHHLGAARLSSWRIAVPPLPEQRRIVEALEAHLSHLDAASAAVSLATRRSAATISSILRRLASRSANSVVMSMAEISRGGLLVDGDWVETRDQDPAGTVRLTQLADVGVAEFRNRSNRWLRTDQAERLRCTYLAAGDVLIARMPDPIARACLVPDDIGEAVTAVDVAVLRVRRPDTDPEWVMLAINNPGFHRKAEAMQSGTTRKRISRRNLAGLALDVPPLEEQRRRVAQARRALLGIGRLDKNLQAINDRSTPALRRSLLAAAFSGRLVPQDPSDEPAELLLKRIHAGREAEVPRTRRTRKAAATQ